MAHPRNNVPPSIVNKLGQNLLLSPGHPLASLKAAIAAHFGAFTCFDRLPPIVTTAQNFDDLLTPANHVSRAPTDTFYVDDGRVLRCHMTAHQTTLLREGHSAFLMAGEVYRRDAVDATHYPIFHQIDGVRVWAADELPFEARASPAATTAFVMADLRATLEGLAVAIFGRGTRSRWVEATFPFTDPSLELEVEWEGRWLEVLGCGMIRGDILSTTGRSPGSVGWAFGMGVERLAMVLHAIPDIRLFWSTDPRFGAQFARAQPGQRVLFAPYSKHPACYKDVTFWLPPAGLHENDVMAAVREVAGDLVEDVTRREEFVHPKSGRVSHCYRILYRSLDKTLTNEETDALQAGVLEKLRGLSVALR